MRYLSVWATFRSYLQSLEDIPLRRYLQEDALAVVKKEPLHGHVRSEERLYKGHVGRAYLTVKASQVGHAGRLRLALAVCHVEE